MNDAFAAKVYPSILYMLSLLERINSGRGTAPTVTDEKPRLKQYLGQLDTRGADQRECELAKAALTYWMDELLVNSRWSNANEWKNNTLERELFDARDRAWEFFEKAKAARSQGRSDALETYYLCVALGFQGIYRDGEQRPAPPAAAAAPPPKPAPPTAPSKGASPQEMTWFSDKPAGGHSGEEQTWGFAGVPTETPPPQAPKPSAPSPSQAPAPRTNELRQDLPRTLQEWAAPVYAQIAPGGLRPFIPTSPAESQRDARPLSGRSSFQRSLNLAIAMSAVTIVLAIWGIV